jgi:SAM-dependent methyltransferase
MTKYIYIDRGVNILTDKEAENALQKENDRKFLSADSGIVRVSTERWQAAQEAELKHWMGLGLKASNDRNDQHLVGFDWYRAIQGSTFNSAIELGCGPFTNMRLIADICYVKECTLLDPLIEHYLAHPNCFYTRHSLSLESAREPLLLKRIRRGILRRFPGMRRFVSDTRKIPIRQIVASPIELMPIDRKYDLLVIVNVIEHCYDIAEVFKNITAVMEKGAIIVFHDKLYSHDTVKQTVAISYDAAHPLQVDSRSVNLFLEGNFTPVYRRIVTHSYTFLGEDISEDTLYFIGKKV